MTLKELTAEIKPQLNKALDLFPRASKLMSGNIEPEGSTHARNDVPKGHKR